MTNKNLDEAFLLIRNQLQLIIEKQMIQQEEISAIYTMLNISDKDIANIRAKAQIKVKAKILEHEHQYEKDK